MQGGFWSTKTSHVICVFSQPQPRLCGTPQCQPHCTMTMDGVCGSVSARHNSVQFVHVRTRRDVHGDDCAPTGTSEVTHAYLCNRRDRSMAMVGPVVPLGFVCGPGLLFDSQVGSRESGGLCNGCRLCDVFVFWICRRRAVSTLQRCAVPSRSRTSCWPE